MQTECNTERFDFQPLEKREVRGIFDGGAITSDAGALLPREVEAKMAIVGRFAGCFTDRRDPELIEHAVDHLIGQRVYGIPSDRQIGPAVQEFLLSNAQELVSRASRGRQGGIYRQGL